MILRGLRPYAEHSLSVDLLRLPPEPVYQFQRQA